MKILIAGSTGLIGQELTAFLESKGHQVVGLSRGKGKGIQWDPENRSIDADKLEGFDAVINLAGENIANSKWTAKKKEKIRTSRVESTRFLCDTLKQLQTPPKVLINSSAIGYYGNVPEGEANESHAAGSGFLASVCHEWEAATECLMGEDIRIVMPRFGVVLSTKGGALKRMLAPFKLGLGGVIGSGRQMMSWVDIEDVARAVEFCLNTESIHGPVNITAPNPVSNREFTKTLGKILSRPTIASMPEFAARLAFGEMAEEMLLSGAKVIPERLLSAGFEFQYPTLKQSLKHLLAQ